MRNVIAFPKQAKHAPPARPMTGAKTLFLHIRQTTLIVHLAAQKAPLAADSRIGTQA